MNEAHLEGANGPPRVLFAGRATLDAVYLLDALPAEDTKVFARGFRMAPGGPACNAAITCALLGGRATLLSAVGRGRSADLLRRDLDGYGVRLIDLAAESAYETPLTTVLANTSAATRTIVNPPAAQLAIAPLRRGWPPEWGERPEVALTDGFSLEEMLPLLQGLREDGVRLCLDGGSWKPGTDAIAPLLTAAIASERFAVPGAPVGAEAALGWFAARGVPHAAVTRGARPILALDRGRRFEIEIEPVDAVDTLGAGDVLHGAFCHAYAGSGDFESALRFAARVATLSCLGVGIAAWQDRGSI